MASTIFDERLNTIRAGLFAGQQIAQGSDRYRFVAASQRLHSLTTGRIAAFSEVLDADVQKRLAERDLILKDLASRLAVLLSASLHELTGTQYATLQQLAKDGHPYAARRFKDARGRVNPRLKRGRAGLPSPGNAINEQSKVGPAALDKSFHFKVVSEGGGLWGVLATSPLVYSGYLAKGTNTLVARAYDRDAAHAAQGQMTDEVAKATAKLEAIGEAVKGLKAPEIEFDLGGLRRDYKPR